MSTTTYPFDPTGTAVSNQIVGERQVLNANNGYASYNTIIPLAAPFYKDTFQATLYPAGTPLVEGVDFAYAFYFIEATRSIGKGVYGGIVLYNNALSGVLSMNYQTVGGQWTLSSTQITGILANVAVNPRITTWEQVTILPAQFPPINHVWDINDMVNMDTVVTAVNAIAAAVGTAQSNAFNTHINNFNNPHLTTAAQVGLGNVQNFGVALTADAQAGVSDILYMTPSTTAAQIAASVGLAFTAHVQNVSNPHNTTAAQVGLGNVPNYPVATVAQAQAGTDNASFMTPVLVNAALAAQGITGFAAHIANMNNPHNTTAAQIGLGSVPNYGMASIVDAQAGVSNTEFMSPSTTAAAITTQALTPLNAHVTNTNNPHNTTAAQVGAYTTAQVNSLLTGYQGALGFTPVQQGGGANMGTNKVYIGWDSVGAGLRVIVDATYLGLVMFQGMAIPISQVTGLQTTLNGLLTTTGTAYNSNNLGGQPPSYYATNTQINSLQSQINSLQSQINSLKGTPAPAPAPAPAPSGTAASFTTSISLLNATFTDTSTPGSGLTLASWTWNFGDGSAVVTTQNATHSYAAGGTYTVTHTATDSGGTTATSSLSISVSAGGGGGGGGGCVEVSMYLTRNLIAANAIRDYVIDGLGYTDDYSPYVIDRAIEAIKIEPQPCWRMVTDSGIAIVCSDSTPMTLRDGSLEMFPNMMGKEVVVDDEGDVRWELVSDLYYVGIRDVALISMSNQNYLAGEIPNRRIGTHNVIAVK